MKKTTKVLAVLTAALMAFAVAGCNNPSASGNTPDPTTSNPTTPDPTTPDPTTPDPTTPDPVVIVLFESETGWSEDWSTKSFAAAQVASATNDSVISMEVSKDTDRLISGTDPATMYNECYTLIQILNFDGSNGKFGAGTATGATITSEPQLEGMFQDSDTNTKFYTVTYKPTAEEWTNIKTNGFGIQAHGTMFKKIEIK